MKQAKIERLTKYYSGQEGMTERKLKNRLAKEEEKERAERGQKAVKDITITIEWKKSKTWGANPHAEANVHFADGRYANFEGYTCSGCGYDKESTVIAQIFNDFLKYKLWGMEDLGAEELSKHPYGIRLSYEFSPYYEGGVGTNCYYRIAEFIGGKFERISSGKTFDVYKFTMNEGGQE